VAEAQETPPNKILPLVRLGFGADGSNTPNQVDWGWIRSSGRDAPIFEPQYGGRSRPECNTYAPEAPRPSAQCVGKMAANNRRAVLFEDGAHPSSRCSKGVIVETTWSPFRAMTKGLVREAPTYNRSQTARYQYRGVPTKGSGVIYNLCRRRIRKWSKAEQGWVISRPKSMLFTSGPEVWPGIFLEVPGHVELQTPTSSKPCGWGMPWRGLGALTAKEMMVERA